MAEGIEGGGHESIMDNMDLPRLYALHRYWAKHPPVSWQMTRFLQMSGEATPRVGSQQPGVQVSPESRMGTAGDLAAMFGLAGRKGSVGG